MRVRPLCKGNTDWYSKGSRESNTMLCSADPSRLAALLVRLHCNDYAPSSRLARQAPRRPKTWSYYFASP